MAAQLLKNKYNGLSSLFTAIQVPFPYHLPTAISRFANDIRQAVSRVQSGTAFDWPINRGFEQPQDRLCADFPCKQVFGDPTIL
jgi:hypothetical protein